MTKLDNSESDQNVDTARQSGIAFVEAAFVILAAGIVLVAIFYWLVPASTQQYQIARAREGVGLSSTIGLSVGRLGEGGEVVDPLVAAQSASTLAKQMLDNSGLEACAQAYMVRSSGIPGTCGSVVLTAISGTLRSSSGANSCVITSTLVEPKIQAVAGAECLGVAYYMGAWYVDPTLINTRGLQVSRKLGFQPDFVVLSGGT